LGTRAITKDHYSLAAKGNIIATTTKVCDANVDEPLVLTQDSTFTLDLPSYLDVVGDDNNSQSNNLDWEADFLDWQGNFDWVMSNSGSDPEVVEDATLSTPNINFDSLDFEHQYIPQHWDNMSTNLLPNRFPFT